MSGIIPRQAAGGVIVPDPDAVNTYQPSISFTFDECSYRAIPSSDCNARIEPGQINAIVSEMLALAECWDADTVWHCNDLNNLCGSFTTYANGIQATLNNHEARLGALEGTGVSGQKIAYCNDIDRTQIFAPASLVAITDWSTMHIPNAGITYNNSIGYFTVLTAGVWSLNAFVNGAQSTTLEQLWVYVNGNPVCFQEDKGTVDQQRGVSLSTILPLQVNDTFSFRLKLDNSASSGILKLQDGRCAAAIIGTL
jgi:hypothetical protein